ncbi:MAG: selenide, water dikinase SelD [Pseudomonadota bacterium]
MESAPLPLTRDVVLIGGGHTHALVLRHLAMNPIGGARLTLINPGPTAPYSGMLPGHVAGHYSRDALDIDLVRLARAAGARLVQGAATGLDPVARRITVAGRPDIRYDIAALDIGITSEMPDLPGFATHAHPAKPLGAFATAWSGFVRRVAAGEAAARVAIIGGGVAGAELSMAMAHRLRAHAPRVTLIEAAEAPLRDVGPRARAHLLRRMADLGVTVSSGSAAAEVTAEGVVLANGQAIEAAFTTGAARALPQPWLAETGLDLTDGFVTVDASLRALGHPSLYAVGDCAHLSHAPRPKAGVYAVREAPILAHNLRADLTGRARRRYLPQRSYLKLISTGGRSAVADKFGLAPSGPALWRWKDRIDQAFMDKFRNLPAMAPPAPKGDVARGVRDRLAQGPACAGCGAKIGAEPLQAALDSLPAPSAPELLTGPGDDAALIRFGDTDQALSTDHLRAFWADPYLFARITAVHALGDVWAMGARPQAALASIILPHMDADMQEETLREVLAGLSEVVREAGGAIVGGHSTLGAEMTLGLTVTGTTPAGRAIALTGAQPGDAILLTKPIGSGTVLAGEMRLQARGADVLAALAIMAQPQGAASAALAPHATAMTDVTGFGLAGHLASLCAQSGVSADLHQEAIPLLPGALALAEAGIRSSLYAQNASIRAGFDMEDTAATALLFDPQTAGGLLATVPAGQAEQVLDHLRISDPAAARIGTITAGPGPISLR